jgi:hypothetical protein
MKRLAVWTFYVAGGVATLYLVLYAYLAFTRHDLQPGDPIHIFRRPDAPNYSRLQTPSPGEDAGALARRQFTRLPGRADTHQPPPV